jgi:hypothetical protein
VRLVPREVSQLTQPRLVLLKRSVRVTRYCAFKVTFLANRLPDVELLTTGGPGVPMLAASYATERGLVVTALVLGSWSNRPGDKKRTVVAVCARIGMGLRSLGSLRP